MPLNVMPQSLDSTIVLPHPLEGILPEEHALYQAAGLDFKMAENCSGEETKYYFVELTEKNPEQLSKNLSHLPWDILHKLNCGIFKYGSEIQIVISQAELLFSLRYQSTVSDNGGRFLEHTQPITAPMRNMVPAEIQIQEQRLAELGIHYSLAALEIEFTLAEQPISGYHHWLEVKQQILSQLHDVLPHLHSPQAESFTKKMQAIEGFNAREILMYELIECDERTSPLLQPLFGTSRDGDGYYDGMNCLELKTRPVSPLQLLDNQRQIIAVLFEKAEAYGLVCNSFPSYHINMSFWDEEGDILATNHPAYGDKGKKIIEGIARGVHDCFALFYPQFLLKHKTGKSTDFLINRENLLRLSDGRFELRLATESTEQDVGVSTALLMAFAAYGLDNDGLSIKPAHPLAVPEISHDGDQYKVLAHLIGNSSLDEQGYLQIAERYAADKSLMLGYELGIYDAPPNGMEVALGIAPREYDGIIQFLRSIRIDDRGIHWPKNHGDIYYVLHVPAINMHKIPENLQERILAGEDPCAMVSDLKPYLTLGDYLPQKERFYMIDLDKLKENLSLQAIKQFYVVTNAYAMDGWENTPFSATAEPTGNQLAYARLTRMEESDAIKQMLSPEFCRGLMECVANAYGKSSDLESSIVQRNVTSPYIFHVPRY